MVCQAMCTGLLDYFVPKSIRVRGDLGKNLCLPCLPVTSGGGGGVEHLVSFLSQVSVNVPL